MSHLDSYNSLLTELLALCLKTLQEFPSHRGRSQSPHRDLPTHAPLPQYPLHTSSAWFPHHTPRSFTKNTKSAPTTGPLYLPLLLLGKLFPQKSSWLTSFLFPLKCLLSRDAFPNHPMYTSHFFSNTLYPVTLLNFPLQCLLLSDMLHIYFI